MDEKIVHNILLKKAKEANYKTLELEQLNFQYEKNLIDFYLNRETLLKLNQLSITENDLKEIYELNKENFIYEERIKLDTIFVSDEELAKKLLEEVNNKNFEELKKKYDEKEKHLSEEFLRGIPLSRIQGQVAEVLSKTTKKGVIRKIINTNGGFHIAFLKDREEARIATFEEAKELLIEEIKKDTYVKIYNEIVNSILNEESKLDNLEGIDMVNNNGEKNKEKEE